MEIGRRAQQAKAIELLRPFCIAIEKRHPMKDFRNDVTAGHANEGKSLHNEVVQTKKLAYISTSVHLE